MFNSRICYMHVGAVPCCVIVGLWTTVAALQTTLAAVQAAVAAVRATVAAV